jgi:hypothetical protein
MKKIIRFLLMCFYYRFKIIKTCDEAKKRNLYHNHNLYGDSINRYSCRSFWYDEYDFLYRCNQLNN